MTPELAAIAPAWYRSRFQPPETMKAACKVFGYSRDELTSGWRGVGVVRARWAVMLAMHRRGRSTYTIGRALGGRDHTTVMHGLQRGKMLEARDPVFARQCLAVAAA